MNSVDRKRQELGEIFFLTGSTRDKRTESTPFVNRGMESSITTRY